MRFSREMLIRSVPAPFFLVTIRSLRGSTPARQGREPIRECPTMPRWASSPQALKLTGWLSINTVHQLIQNVNIRVFADETNGAVGQNEL